jgi:hypothetical protein
MPIPFIIDSLDAIPEELTARELFAETGDGKFKATGIEGVAGADEVSKLNNSLSAQRGDFSKFKEKVNPLLSRFDGDVEKALAELDRVSELEAMLEAAKASGAGEDVEGKIEELLGKRIKTHTAPLERARETLTRERDELAQRVQEFEARERNRAIKDTLTEVAGNAKLRPESIADLHLLGASVFEVNDDGSLVTKANPYGIDEGLTPDLFIDVIKKSRPHWWPNSEGAGAKGSGAGSAFADNPWSTGKINLTKQGEILRKDPALAQRMMKAAGVG